MSNGNPGFVYDQVPTAGQWNAAFGAKQDWNAVLDQLIAQGGAPSFVVPTAWTPVDASGASLVFTSVSAEYTVVGNIAIASTRLTYPTTADTSAASIGGLPYGVPNVGYASAPELGYVVGAAAVLILPLINTSHLGIFALATGSAVTNVILSGKTLSFQVAWPLT